MIRVRSGGLARSPRVARNRVGVLCLRLHRGKVRPNSSGSISAAIRRSSRASIP